MIKKKKYKSCIWSKDLNFLGLPGVGKLFACSIKTLLKVFCLMKPSPSSINSFLAELIRARYWHRVQRHASYFSMGGSRIAYKKLLSNEELTGLHSNPCSAKLWAATNLQGSWWAAWLCLLPQHSSLVLLAYSVLLQFSSEEKPKTLLGVVSLSHFWRIAVKAALK